MRAHREGRRVVVDELSPDELHLLVLMAQAHCLDCFPERLHRQIDVLGKALAKLEQGERMED